MYGLWINGERFKWFDIDEKQLLQNQLTAIEEERQK